MATDVEHEQPFVAEITDPALLPVSDFVHDEAVLLGNTSVIPPGTYKVHCKAEGTYKSAVLNVLGQRKADFTPVVCFNQLPPHATGFWKNDNFKIESVPNSDKYTLLCEATGTVLTAQSAAGVPSYPIVMCKRRSNDPLQEWHFKNYAGGQGEPPVYHIINAKNRWVVTLQGGKLDNYTPIVGQNAFPDYKPMQGWWLDKQA